MRRRRLPTRPRMKAEIERSTTWQQAQTRTSAVAMSSDRRRGDPAKVVSSPHELYASLALTQAPPTPTPANTA